MTYEFDSSEYDEPFTETDEHDDGMAEFWQTDGIPAQALLRLTYEDSSGQVSERLFETRLFTEPDSTFSILGHCHMRNAERTLRIDQITQCVDERTGKVVDDVYEYLFDLYRQTPVYSLDNVLADHGDTLRALAYVLDTGGRWQSHGHAVLGIASRKLSGDSRVTDTMLAPHLESVSGGSLQAYRMVIGRLNKSLSSEAKSAVLRLATKVANLDGHISGAEQEALDYMVKRFSKSE
jgi:hypothetical protein